MKHKLHTKVMESTPLSINELRDVFFSLKIKKSPVYSKITVIVVKKCLNKLCDALKCMFGLSLENEFFPVKIFSANSVFKGGDCSKLGNYKPILMLSCFSKILERIMYDCFYI